MYQSQLSDSGFTIVPEVLAQNECDALVTRLAGLELGAAGTRNLLHHRWCGELARTLIRHPIIGGLLSSSVHAVQCTLFEKSPRRNWLVAFHQDLSIPVATRVDHDRCSGWSEKEGVTFTQPGPEVLRKLVAVRLHIDACPSTAGPLRVVPGSHHWGQLSPPQIAAARGATPEVQCAVPRGGIVAMKPLLLHASSKASFASVRRVLHFLFGPSELPYGLRWRVAD